MHEKNWKRGTEKLAGVYASDRDPDTIHCILVAKDDEGRDVLLKIEKDHREFMKRLTTDQDLQVINNTLPFTVKERTQEEKEQYRRAAVA